MIIPAAGLALPVVKTLADCADFSKTVWPFVDQLNRLPQQILQAGLDLDAWKSLYVSTNPLISSLAFALAISPIFLVVSEVNKNYSQVDRCWSFLPTIYNVHYAIWARMNGLPTQRLDNILAFSVCWSIRLTFNYWRKGGYSIGSEDYRWEIVKSKVSPFVMFLFNIVFISLAQSFLLFSITTPTYILMLCSRLTGAEMSYPDIVFARILMGFVLFEFFADQQQWDFHKAKSYYQKNAKVPPGWERNDMDRGFCTSALWQYSRHPNFLAEQAIWMVLYQWSCWETYSMVNWTFIGAMSYLLLFQASTWLTEMISSEKYPEYKIYQQRVGKFVPNVKDLNAWDHYLEMQEKAQAQKKK